MTRLLVSVRSLDEAILAADAGVDLIDVKEPARGSLGMAAADIRRGIGQRLGQRYSLSAAYGELLDCEHSRAESSDPIDWAGYRFAKIGLAGCAENSQWRDKWLAWRSTLPAGIEPVLVCYADGQHCGAPCYDELLAFAGEAKVQLLLFDTWDKRGPGLCQLWQPADFLRVGQELQQAGISFVFAGKIELADVARLSRSGAKYIGIRGAACEPVKMGDDVRCGKLSVEKIKIWLQSLRIAIYDTTQTA
jgi:uncharacterized protein (UPF0264 family)